MFYSDLPVIDCLRFLNFWKAVSGLKFDPPLFQGFIAAQLPCTSKRASWLDALEDICNDLSSGFNGCSYFGDSVAALSYPDKFFKSGWRDIGYTVDLDCIDRGKR